MVKIRKKKLIRSVYFFQRILKLNNVFSANGTLSIELKPVSYFFRVKNVLARKLDESFAFFKVGHANATLNFKIR